MSRSSHLLLLAMLLSGLAVASAKAQDAPTLSPDQIAAQIRPLHPKTVVLVFDVTASTRTNGVFGNERAASAMIIRDGCAAGDRVVLDKFGTGYKTVFDQTLTSDADKDALIDQLPAGVEPGAGTNIRWPHAAALQTIRAALPRPGVVVLLTDSFNDRPLTSDPNYPKYLAYYTLKGLTVYPDTPENRNYERLLRTLQASGKLHQYGVGVGVAPSGRPIERLPVGPGQGDAGADTTTVAAPTVLTPIGTAPAHSPYIVPVGAGVLVLILVPLLFLLMRRAVPVRLRLGDKGTPRDYRLKQGAKIALGGSPTSAAPGDEVFPLTGLSIPAAFVANAGGGVSLTRPADLPAGVGVFHNGLPLEQSVRLRAGDEIRLSDANTTPAREHRVHFDDPHTAAF